MADGFEVRGNLPQLSAHLNRIGRELAAKVVRAASAAAARVFKRHAQRLAPVLKPENRRKGRIAGALRRNLYIKRSRDRDRGREHYFIGFRQGKRAARKGRDTFYGRFLEGGWIPRGPGKGFGGGQRTRALNRSRARTGGAREVSYPFMRPAFARGRGEALGKFYAVAGERIAKISAEKTSR